LDLVVTEAAVLAMEGHEDDLLERGDLGKKEIGHAVLVAVHAEALDARGSLIGSEIGEDGVIVVLGLSLLSFHPYFLCA
jgi:hypothetical protein